MLGLVSTGGCCLGLILFGHIGDKVKNMRLVLVALSLVSTLLFVWFTLTVNRTLPPSDWQLYLSCVLGSMTLNAGSPLLFEAAAEMYVRATVGGG